jgi:hypothetical protein
MVKIKDLKDLKVYELSRLAECGSPDSQTSPGALFLTSVRDDVVDQLERYDSDMIDTHEIADGAPSVYTHQLWCEFVDLEAYNEDPSEFGGGDDMTAMAAACLYAIAERLAQALIEYALDDE